MQKTQLDPDRFFNFTTPGAQEWWYFDASSHDGRDALVLIWFAALPFDPSYGIAARKHLTNPDRYPAPFSLDHCAFNLCWYRDGRLIAYALNRYRHQAFEHSADPFSLTVAGNRIDRDDSGYSLHVETPALGGGTLKAHLRFTQKPGTEPFEQDLGTPGFPHLWILAAADNKVTGHVALHQPARNLSLDFQGRGYHDHNAGAQELSLAIRRWSWGRAHSGPFTHVYYKSQPREGPPHSLRLTCEDGRLLSLTHDVPFTPDHSHRPRNFYGLHHANHLHVGPDHDRLTDLRQHCVDDGPFYRRWVGGFKSSNSDVRLQGVSELLDTRFLHHRLFNWMIPYRLKSPQLQ